MESSQEMTRRSLACAFLLSTAAATARRRSFIRLNPTLLPAPAIVMIPGAGGLVSQKFPCRKYGRALTQAGFVVFLASDITAEEPYDDAVSKVSEILQDVRRSSADVLSRIGLIGFSRGGTVALLTASQRKDVAAVVAWAGNLPDDRFQEVQSLPPLLLVHGTEDTVIPLRDGQQVTRWCETKGLACDLKVLEGAGHGFRGHSEEEAIAATIAFFHRHL